MSISVSNLSKTYGSQRAVNDISFSVGKGEIVGFLGPNGAGKSTTMKMLTGYLQPDQGQISVCGLDTLHNSAETKKRIGYLPEANPLYMEMYVKEYLGFIADLHEVADAVTRINSVIEMVGLKPEAHKKIHQLSKGYKQRVGLAAALVHNPEVLILDEPTTGLDPNQIIEIREVIRSLASEKTILFSSHIMQEVEAICDRVIIIHKGQIVANDRLENLQQENGQQVIVVQFSEAVDKARIEQLADVSQVTKAENNSFSIKCANTSTVKKLLLQMSVDENLNIISLQTRANSLENIFKSLTT